MRVSVGVSEISISRDIITSGEYNIHDVDFEFSKEYGNLVKIAVFSTKDKVYKINVINNKCIIPWEVLTESGDITLGVYGFGEVNNELILRYSPVPITITVEKGSYIDHSDNTEPLTPTDVEQIMIKLNNIDLKTWKSENKTYIKMTNPDGVTTESVLIDGVDGKDYVITDADYQAIADIVLSDITIPTKLSELQNDVGYVKNTDFNTSQALQNEKIQELEEENNDLYNALPKVTAEGTSLTLNDTKKAKMKLALGGNTEQANYNGEIPSPSPDYPQTIHTVTGDNTVTVAGVNYPINLGTMELCKIGDYQDRIFKAVDGDIYYDTLTAAQKAELTYGKWYVHKETGKVTLDGSEEWKRDSSNIAYVNIPNAYGRNTHAYSNYFKYTNTANNTAGYMKFGNSNNNLIFYKMDTEYGDLNGFKSWLSTHNTTVYYVIATSTNTEITDTTLISQLEVLYLAKSAEGTTTITQTNADDPFILTASAIMDITALL